MKPDEVLKIARDCGIHVPTVIHSCITNKDELLAFAAAIERATVEKAVQICVKEADDAFSDRADEWGRAAAWISVSIGALAAPGNGLDIHPGNGEIQVVTLAQDYVVGD